jgi:ribosomal protein S18 acetylase RimI-like enzyme
VTTALTPGLRTARPGDAEVLYQIYASTREEELAPVPWDAATKEAFLRMQFAAQDTDYHAKFPNACYDLIVAGERVLGRMYLYRGKRVWELLDIALLPQYRSQGIGTRLLTDLLDEARAAAKPVRIYVERFNPARHLYDRLGFHEITDHGVYQLMEWNP